MHPSTKQHPLTSRSVSVDTLGLARELFALITERLDVVVPTESVNVLSIRGLGDGVENDGIGLGRLISTQYNCQSLTNATNPSM